MSRPPLFSNTIHIRDFVNSVVPDLGRENTPNYIEIHADINIFEENDFFSHDIIVGSIRTRIHAYLSSQEQILYCPNAFFYTDGRFSAIQLEDGTLELNVQSLSLMRHPGDATNPGKYQQHLPERWCPMVTIIGSVRPTPTTSSVEHPQPRCFTIDTSVYDASKAAPTQFSAVCFLEDTKRWEKVKTPTPGSFLTVTAKVAGRTSQTNLLALRVLDLTYLPRPGSSASVPTPTSTPTPKRSGRWDARVPSTTPSKKQRTSDPVDEIAIPPTTPSESSTISVTSGTGSAPTLPSDPIPPSTKTHYDDSPTLLHDSDNATRPYRNRHPPKKIQL